MIILRIVLWGLLGAAMALAGFDLYTMWGAVVAGLLLAILVADWIYALAMYRRGVRDGATRAVFKLHQGGWRKP